MSTPGSKKRRLALGAIVLALATYGILAFGLGRLAWWAESSFETYPYVGGQEALRWLMPSMFHRKPDVLIVGPSAIGEDVLYEVLSQAVGGRVLSAALSNGTIDDVAIGLDYVARVFGPEALPKRVILGMTPRVLANYPRNFGSAREPDAYAPLIRSINKYSSHYRVRSERLGSVLQPASLAQKWSARRHWFAKQQTRHRTAVLAGIEYLLDPTPVKIGYQTGLPYFTDLRTPLDEQDWSTSLRYVRSVGPAEAARHWLPGYRSPYYHTFMKPRPLDIIARQTEDWDIVYSWDPLRDEEIVRYQLGRIRDFLARYDIGLTIIHAPEHPLSRARYQPAFYKRYRRWIAEELPDAQIIDMWEMPANLFYDQIHLAYDGAQLMTDRIAPAIVQSLLSRQ